METEMRKTKSDGHHLRRGKLDDHHAGISKRALSPPTLSGLPATSASLPASAQASKSARNSNITSITSPRHTTVAPNTKPLRVISRNGSNKGVSHRTSAEDKVASMPFPALREAGLLAPLEYGQLTANRKMAPDEELLSRDVTSSAQELRRSAAEAKPSELPEYLSEEFRAQVSEAHEEGTLLNGICFGPLPSRPRHDRGSTHERSSAGVVGVGQGSLGTGRHGDASMLHRGSTGTEPGEDNLAARQKTGQIDQMIHNTPLFKECSYDMVETILLDMRNLIVKPGQPIVTQGQESPQSMFFVLYGDATISCQGQNCAVLQAGQYFGESMLFGTSKIWKISVAAKSQCMISELSRQCWENGLQNHKDDKLNFEARFSQLPSKRNREEREASSWLSLRRSCLFGGASEALLRDIDANMDRRLYFPGDEIFREGDTDDCMYVLDHGSVAIQVAGRTTHFEEIPRVRTVTSNGDDYDMLRKQVELQARRKSRASMGDFLRHGSAESFGDAGRKDAQPYDEYLQHVENSDGLPPGAILGEECLLGEPCRTKTAQARTIVDTRVLYRPVFMAVLANYHMEGGLLIETLVQRREDIFPTVYPIDYEPLQEVGCSDEFFDFLSSHIEERIIGPGERVQLDDLRKHIHPPVPKEQIFFAVLNKGRLQMHTAGRVAIMEDDFIEEGSFVPGGLFWNDTQWVTAVETSYLSVLHRVVLAKAMEEFPIERDIFMPILHDSSLDLEDNFKSRMSNLGSKQAKRGNPEQVTKILRDRSIFANASPEFLDEIVTLGTIRVFMPGERIIEQGTDGNSMFILWVGTANVAKETLEDTDSCPSRTLTNVGALTHGSVFGELVMLGVQSKRTASIIAGTVCCTWEVQHHTILAILDRHLVERASFLRLVEEHLDKLAAPQIIHHPLFSVFHQQFRTLLAVNCERKLFFPQQIILRENTQGDSLFIMNLGSAFLEIGGHFVMPVTGGSHFGFSMIALDDSHKDRFPGTLIAETMCQVLVIGRETYLQAVIKYPEMRDIARCLDREERQRLAKQKAAFSRLVQRRRGLRCIIDALRGETAKNGNSQDSGEDETSVQEARILKVSFDAWRLYAQRIKEHFQQEQALHNRNSQRIHEWLTKRKVQMELVKPRQALKILVDENLATRGPLKLAKDLPYELPEQKSLSLVFSETQSSSPYMAPAPVWRPDAWTKRQQQRRRQLPPLPRATAVGRNPQSVAAPLPSTPRSPPRTAPEGNRNWEAKNGPSSRPATVSNAATTVHREESRRCVEKDLQDFLDFARAPSHDPHADELSRMTGAISRKSIVMEKGLSSSFATFNTDQVDTDEDDCENSTTPL